MKIKLENGIELDDEEGAAPSLKRWADSKGLKNVRVFATSMHTYLMVIGEAPEFESEKAEDVAAHIDIMALALQAGWKGD